MKKTQYQFSFVHFMLNDSVHIEVYKWVLLTRMLKTNGDTYDILEIGSF